MVSARENPRIDDIERLQPVQVKAVPSCYQDLKTFKQSKFDCIMCDFFEDCKRLAINK